MVLNISFQKQENLNLIRCCHLHGKQLTNYDSILCTRIVYYDISIEEYQEVIEFAENKITFSRQSLAYLRAESWMKDFPHSFEVKEYQLAELSSYYCYVCVTGYKNKNHKPEYIQVITTEPMCKKLLSQLENSAKLLNQYVELYSNNFHQKSRIQLLEHVLHKASHQLRNSLSSISIYAQNLYLRLQDNYYRKQAEIINQSVNKLDFNLTEILSCGQGVILNIAPQDIKEIVAKSINDFQPIISKKHLKIHTPEKSTTLQLDKLQIQQVFDNLIGNAIHFSPDFGNIVISCQTFQEETFIQIRDDGPGISPEDRNKIFDPFYTRRNGGTGLGLTIAKKIVLDHSGKLWVENAAQGGAVFSMILPKKQY
ncbi:MAG: HAMP domain-containing sensor histidine kinase [Rivularia sp. (in: cyanobacteria)]|jgi:signal transduction histidine kinase